MKSYYELLEVNENASKEVIEKAYKVLAKKYHPDVQPKDKMFWAEATFKKITEAYEVLSDPEKRIVYDFQNGFADQGSSYEDKYNKLYFEQEELKRELHFLKNKRSEKSDNEDNSTSTNGKFGISHVGSFIKVISQAIYNEAKKDKIERNKDLKALFLTIIIMLILLFIFWKVPFIRNFLFP